MKTVDFTRHQLEAIDAAQRHADTCVVAGPGSGKTTVLVEYFRRLVESGVDPVRILAITFTEKAAGNMRTKLAEAFHEDSKTRARLERAWVSTVHGFCARLLRENAVAAGVDPQFQVADEREARRLQQEAIDAAVAALFEQHPAAVRALIRGLSSREFEEAVLSAYDAMRGAGMTIEEVAAMPAPPGITREEVAATLQALSEDPLDLWSDDQRLHRDSIIEGAARILMASTAAEALRHLKEFPGNLQKCKRGTTAYHLVKRLKDEQLKGLEYSLVTELYEHERELLVEILRRFDRIYRERKRDAGVLDFADLEEYAAGLLEGRAEARARVQEQFDYIVMDEFQDTNGQQAKLLERLRRAERFYAVGDINQSIYGFRHAEPDVFRAYRDQASRRIELDDNFRSRTDILRAVETIAEGAAGIERRKLLAGRQFQDQREVCVEVIAAIAPQIDEALHNEARWVARRILELAGEAEGGFAFREMAVLVRNTEVLPEFAEAFDEAGIPYVVNRGRGFYEIREVNDLVHLLRVIANPRDEISVAAVLRSPLVQASDEALLRLKALDANLGAALMRLRPEIKSEFDPEDYYKLARLRERLQTWRQQREHVSFDRLLLTALDDCGYSGEPGSRSFGSIEKFLGQARQAAGRMSLDQFIDELAVVRASNPREPDAPPQDSLNAVSVMTIHSAKGLEFPVVFVAALHKGVDPNPPVVSFSRSRGLGARWRNPATGRDKSDRFQHAIREEWKQREAEEGNRVLYVAMTRAEQQLILSFSAAAKKPAHWAQEIRRKLGLDLETAGGGILTRTSPYGEEWKLRFQVADREPEALPRPQWAEPPAPAQRVARPRITEQQDANATVTAVAAFAKCPREYFLSHYLGYEGRARRIEERGKLPAAELGTQVHALLAGAAVSKPDSEALRLAEVFRQSPLGRRGARASRVEREFDFLMAVDGLVLRGQVDLWFEEGGELTIVDYKTDSVTAIEAHERAGDYHAQLRLYALAVERATGRAPQRAWLHFLRPDTPIEVDLTPSLLDAPEQIVRDFQEAQARMEFPLHEGAHCRRCEFFHGLCASSYEPDKTQGARSKVLPLAPR